MSRLFKCLSIIFIFCIFTLSCELKKAEQEYNKGNYLESMEIVFHYLDKNPDKLSKMKPKMKADLTEKFSNIIRHYSQKSQNSGDLNQKMEGNISLFVIYSMIEGREYAGSFTPLNNFINQNSISGYLENAVKASSQLSDIYINNGEYKKAIEITDRLSRMYSAAGKLSEKSARTGLIQKYSGLRREIAQHRADSYIRVAEIYEERGELRAAQKLYLEASEIYSPFSRNYRNSYDKYSSVKHKADLDDADEYYSRGKRLYNGGRASRSDMRKANEYFSRAAEYVQDYKDVKSLITETEKGFFRYSVLTNYNDYSSTVSDFMKNIGKKTDINPELIFEYIESTDYDVRDYSTDTENLKKKIEKGRDLKGNPVYEEYSFTKRTVTKKETVTVHYFFKITGAYSYSKNDSVSYTNTFTETSYSGKVPPEYSSKTEGRMEKSEIIRKMRPDIENKLKSYLKTAVYNLEKM